MNGAHLILKAWEAEKALEEISYENLLSSSKFMDYNIFLYTRKPQRILARKLMSSINRKCIMARFLRIKVDIDVNKPIPACFF